MTYRELLHYTRDKFQLANVECGDFAAHATDFFIQITGVQREKLFLMQEDSISSDDLTSIKAALKRRVDGEPLQYIVGYAWFWNSKFKVGPGVLIPRKETEHLVEFLLSLPEEKSIRVGELGAGSGNIGISVLQNRPHWKWYGFELNPNSLPYLEQNVGDLLPNGSHYEWIAGDFFTESQRFAPFDLIVSNPPYISQTEKETLSREVRHEPELALYSGTSGTDHLEKLLKKSSELLIPGGTVVSEIGSDQGTVAKGLAARHGYENVNVLKDMAGFDRILIARKCSEQAGSSWIH